MICPVCNNEFVPSHKAHKFCSKKCYSKNYRYMNEELKEKKRVYYTLHKDETNYKKRIWYMDEKNKKKIAERDKSYRERNKEKIAIRMKKYREKNKDMLQMKSKKYNETHKNEKSICNKIYREKHKDVLTAYLKQWRQDNKKKCKEYSKRAQIKNKDARKLQGMKSYYKHRDKRLLYSKIHRASFTEEQKQHERDLQNSGAYKRRREKIEFKIRGNLANRLRSAIKNNSKSEKTELLIGCSFEFLKKHIESQWSEGMSWDNYTTKGWHIDHIIPCASFDLSKEEEQKKCFHYTNLQPLWWYDNLSKHSKLTWSKEKV